MGGAASSRPITAESELHFACNLYMPLKSFGDINELLSSKLPYFLISLSGETGHEVDNRIMEI